MNNQFSQRVSDIITYSKEEANRLKNRYIGPEHLLLGMLRDGGGKAIEILQKLDIDLNRVKKLPGRFFKRGLKMITCCPMQTFHCLRWQLRY